MQTGSTLQSLLKWLLGQLKGRNIVLIADKLPCFTHSRHALRS